MKARYAVVRVPDELLLLLAALELIGGAGGEDLKDILGGLGTGEGLQ